MRLRAREKPDAGAIDLSDTVLRLAVLLQAGIPPQRAWEQLGRAGNPAAARVHAAHARGGTLAQAIGGVAPDGAGVWTELAAAWEVATTVGAPLAETLRGLAASLRDAQEAADDVKVALAEPSGTARLMAWLPLAGLALSLALGFDTVGTLVGNPLGIACLVGGVLLILAARRWNAALVRRAAPSGGIPGVDAELLAIALSGGVSLDRARALAAAATGRTLPPEVDATLDLSREAGAPAVELLRASASLARHRARVEGRLRAAALSGRLLLPLGVCTLPAFLLLGVAPMLLGVAATVPLEL